MLPSQYQEPSHDISNLNLSSGPTGTDLDKSAGAKSSFNSNVTLHCSSMLSPYLQIHPFWSLRRLTPDLWRLIPPSENFQEQRHVIEMRHIPGLAQRGVDLQIED